MAPMPFPRCLFKKINFESYCKRAAITDPEASHADPREQGYVGWGMSRARD